MSLGDVFKALADPTRRQMIRLLRQRPHSAGELAAQFDITRPSISFHLGQLRDAGLIYGERAGSTITYHLNLSVLEDLMAFATDLWKGTEDDRQTGDSASHRPD